MSNGAAQIVQMKNDKFRNLETFTMPTAAGPTRTKIPITEGIRRIMLHVAGTAVIDGGGADGTLTAESILSVIRNITLTGTSSKRSKIGDIKVADGAALFNLQSFLKGTPPLKLEPTPITKGSSPAFYFNLPIDLEMAFSQDPRQTILNTKELTSLYLNIDWGSSADVFSAGTITTMATTCRVSVSEFVDEFIKQGRYSLNQLSYIEEGTATANASQTIRLKRGNLLRGVLIKQFTRSGVYYHTPVDMTGITEVSLEVNREVRKKFTWRELQAENKINYQMPSMPTGYAFLDLMPEARFDTIVDTSKFDDIDIVVNAAGLANSYVRLYPIEIVS